MKRMLAIAMAAMVAAGAQAAVEAQPVKKADGQAEKKVEKSKGWIDNFETARAEAKAFGLPIFAFFTGSDWCGWCVRLHKEVLGEKAFQNFAAENLILFEADFPRGKKLAKETVKQNEELAAKYGVQGFPTVFLLDAEGKTLGQTGYRPGGAKEYVKHLKELLEAAGVKAKESSAAKSPTPYEKMKAEKAAAAKAAAEKAAPEVPQK